MNRGLEQGAKFTGVALLVLSLHFIAGVLGDVPGVLVGLAAGGAVAWMWVRTIEKRMWLAVLLPALCVALSTAIVEVALRRSFWLWLSPVAATVGSAAALWVSLRSRTKCALCDRTLDAGAVVFKCPRCGLEVCDEACWEFEHRRCHQCLEQRVPILAIEESWWMRVTGPRAQQGRCQICLGAANAVDLRACPHCRRPQCRSCWDFNNGECARCMEALPELPPALAGAVVQMKEVETTWR